MKTKLGHFAGLGGLLAAVTCVLGAGWLYTQGQTIGAMAVIAAGVGALVIGFIIRSRVG